MKISLTKVYAASLATFGAFLEGVGTIIEKKTLKLRGVNHKNYLVFGFLLIILAGIPVFFILNNFFPDIFAWKIAKEAFLIKNVIIFSFVIIASTIANFFVYYAMKWEKITELEPIRLSQSFFVIILAFIFYASERTTPTHTLIAALIASFALIFSHIKKHHISFNKYALASLLGSFFFALELVISKSLLGIYSPLAFYIVRCIFIFLVLIIIFNKKITNVNKKAWKYMAFTGIIWVIYRAILYYSYQLRGMIFTTLLFLLAPVFIYILSYKYLKERPNWRNILAAIIIVLCVLYATIFNGS